MNTEIYRVNLRIQSEYGKIGARKTPNSDTFYAVPNIVVITKFGNQVVHKELSHLRVI